MSDRSAIKVLNSVDWRNSIACWDADPELFFPIGKGDVALSQAEEAKAVCRECTAIGYCLLNTFFNGDGDGISGGTTPEERRAFRGEEGFDPLEKAQEFQDDFAEQHPGAIALPPIIEAPLDVEEALA